jgi:hypothetical protein
LDLTTDTPTPGQMLMGGPQQQPQQVGNVPLEQRLAQMPSQQQPQQQQPPAPTPQQVAVAQRHQDLGKTASFLFGEQYDNDGTPIKQAPGQLFRSLLAGALLGFSAGASAPTGGGKLGSILGGAGRGGTAVMQQNYERGQQAQANQLRAQEEQRKQAAANREESGFQTEQTLKQAMIAHENLETIRTQQLINSDTLKRYQVEAENGVAKSQVYAESGIDPLVRDQTPDEQHNTMKTNPAAVAWDWEQTGVKTVLVRDKNGKDVSTYVPTFSAYDPNKTVTITPGFIDLMKKADIDSVYPGTTDHIKAGQQLKPSEFVALKGQYQKAYNDQLQREKDGLASKKTKAEIDDYQAQAIERAAQAARANKAEKQSQLLADGLDEWNKAYGDLTKTNPDASRQDAFAKLSPKAQFAITVNLTKTVDSLERQIKDALSQFPPDQQRANELKEDQENYRAMQRMAMGVTKSALPKPPQQGAPITDDVMSQYNKTYQDPAQAKQAAARDGWGPPAPVVRGSGMTDAEIDDAEKEPAIR